MSSPSYVHFTYLYSPLVLTQFGLPPGLWCLLLHVRFRTNYPSLISVPSRFTYTGRFKSEDRSVPISVTSKHEVLCRGEKGWVGRWNAFSSIPLCPLSTDGLVHVYTPRVPPPTVTTGLLIRLESTISVSPLSTTDSRQVDCSFYRQISPTKTQN